MTETKDLLKKNSVMKNIPGQISYRRRSKTKTVSIISYPTNYHRNANTHVLVNITTVSLHKLINKKRKPL